MRLRQLKKKLNNTRHLIAKTDSDYSESVFYLCLPICNLLSDDLKGCLKNSKQQTTNLDGHVHVYRTHNTHLF